MDTKALRQKILDLAIRGKLVPQDPNDEPAAVLLERIRSEKQQMVKDGKLKAKDVKNDTIIFKGEDNLHYEKFQDGTVKCIEDEIPFELPDGWEWCRGIVCFKGMESQKPSGDFFDYIDIESVDNKTHTISQSKHILVKDAPSRASRKVENGSVIFSLVRPYLENIAFISEKYSKCIVSTGFYVCNSSGALFPRYMFMLMTSKYVVHGLNQFMKGDNSPSIRKEDIENWLYPIPPFEEQKSIVKQLNSILQVISEIRDNRNNLADCIAVIKSKIYELALRGKLVPHDSNDEPASVLLERIHTEKEELIKQGKIKPDKKESIIFRSDDNSYYEKFEDGITKNIDNEIPFDIPKSWMFVRLKQIGNIIGGGTPKTNHSEYWNGNIPWITPADLSGYTDIYITGGERTITELGLRSSSAQLLPTDTVLYSSRAPIGYVVIAANPIATNQGFKSIVPFINGMSNYLYYCLIARTNEIIQHATGTTFKEISGSQMGQTIIPLPPIDEQQRICQMIKCFMNSFAYIEECIANSSSDI